MSHRRFNKTKVSMKEILDSTPDEIKVIHDRMKSEKLVRVWQFDLQNDADLPLDIFVVMTPKCKYDVLVIWEHTGRILGNLVDDAKKIPPYPTFEIKSGCEAYNQISEIAHKWLEENGYA